MSLIYKPTSISSMSLWQRRNLILCILFLLAIFHVNILFINLYCQSWEYDYNSYSTLVQTDRFENSLSNSLMPLRSAYSKHIPSPHGESGFVVVYTWVNGSDHYYQAMKTKYRNGTMNLNRFRDFDELRHSIRSVTKHIKSWIDRIIVIAADYRDIEIDRRTLHGQIPTWLNQSHHEKILDMIYHDELFQDQSALPTFNSVAIETQLAQLKNIDDKIILYFNDDCFLGRNLQPTDFYSVENGFVYSLEETLTVEAFQTLPPLTLFSTDELQGEWPSLFYANYLLSKRFGIRTRSYVSHSIKAFTVPLLRELYQMFEKEFIESAKQKFRGDGWHLHTAFMMIHYVMEMHRESVIKTFVYGLLDADGNGLIDEKEIQLVNNLIDNAKDIDSSGIPLPKYNDSAVLWKWDSRNGYPYMIINNHNLSFYSTNIPCNKRLCALKGDLCFSEMNTSMSIQYSADGIFKKWAHEQISCGDCLLNYLARADEHGIETYLTTQAAVRLTTNEDQSRFDRYFINIARYRYTVASQPFAFIQLVSATCATYSQLIELVNNPPGIMCFNDNVNNDEVEVSDMLKRFYHAMWPTPLSCENSRNETCMKDFKTLQEAYQMELCR